MKLVTTEQVPGYDILASLGVVVACVPFFGSKYTEGIGDLHGNSNPDVCSAFERRRRQALHRLVALAGEGGADAVVGVTFTDREITNTWKEICAYGTAVTLRRRT